MIRPSNVCENKQIFVFLSVNFKLTKVLKMLWNPFNPKLTKQENSIMWTINKIKQRRVPISMVPGQP